MEAVKLVEDRNKENYGDLVIVQSETYNSLHFQKISNLTDCDDNKTVLIRARIHNSRAKANLAFFELREGYVTIQAACFKSETITKEMIKYISGIPKESIVDVECVVKKVEKEIKSCTTKWIELHIQKMYVVNRSSNILPFQIEDASRKVSKEDEKNEISTTGPVVGMTTRLDNRIIDLRTPANQAIFRSQSAVCKLFRDYLDSEEFIEIHTPKLLGGSSEGGTNVFKLKYFEKDACLAQSPQLYKQMMVMADFERVFEIGPVFRAENSNTHRHLCEFTGLDLEMTIKESYLEVLDVIGGLFHHIFKGLTTIYARECQAIYDQHPAEPFLFSEKPLLLTYHEGIQLLKEAGIEQSVHEDLNTTVERQLGKIVRDKYKTDFYILHKYPESARPFYTMLCKDDPRFTCSYDVFMRGEEIISGAQRIHDPVLLAQRATEKGILVSTIKEYIEAFKYGAFPHGGCGIGLERVVMLFFDLGNIRKTSAFPRDPQRLTP